jgi:hypothetical protein
MLKRLGILLLAGLIGLCATTGIVLGMVATNQLVPPAATLQLGPATMRMVPPCDLDRVASAPCLLPGSELRWLLQLEIRSPSGGRQRWALYGRDRMPWIARGQAQW